MNFLGVPCHVESERIGAGLAHNTARETYQRFVQV